MEKPPVDEIDPEEQAEGGAKVPSLTAPEIAARIMHNCPVARSGGSLYYYDRQAGVYRADGDRFVARTVATMSGVRWSNAMVASVQGFLAATVPELLEDPPKEEINVRNGILNIKTGKLRPHSQEFLSPIQINATYNPNAACPNIEKFVSEVFPEDALPIAYELAGYILTPYMGPEAAFLFMGRGSNGKSTYCYVLEQLLGPSNVSSVALQTLDRSRFASGDLVGMLANINADLDITGLRSCGTFKAVVSGDLVRAERKFGQPFSFHPFVKLIFSANEYPQTTDTSYGFYRRWKAIPFNQQFEGDERDLNLKPKLVTDEELSGLLNLAIKALIAVQDRGGFMQAASLDKAMEEFKRATDPITSFVESHCNVGRDCEVSKPELYQAFSMDCMLNNAPSMSSRKFNSALQDRVNLAERTMQGAHLWVGIELKAEAA